MCKHVKYGWKTVEIEYEGLKMIVNGQKWVGMSVDDWEWLEIGQRKWGQSNASAFILKRQKTAQSSQYWVLTVKNSCS
jgi:hypothetical protein